MRCISELIALLIVLVIVVGATVAGAMIISSIMQKQAPNSVDLSVGGGSASLEGSALVVKVIVMPVGDDVRITNVEVYKGSTLVTYTLSKMYSPTKLLSGSSYEIIVTLFGVSSVSQGDNLVVVIYWSGLSSGTSGASKGTVKVT